MREIFRAYGEQCNYNVSILINCETSMEVQDNIYKSGKFPCRDKNRYRGRKQKKHRMDMDKHTESKYPSLMETSYVRVKAGHITYGMKGLEIPNGDKPIYISWMRDPFQMLISLALYLMEKSSFKGKRTVENAKKLIIQKLRNPKRLVSKEQVYSQYAAYYLTNNTVGTSKLSLDEVRREIFANMDNFSLVGILESHNTSMKMLQKLLDPKLVLSVNFWDEDRGVINKSKVKGLTRESIVQELLKADGLMKDISNALAFEQSIYDYGRKLHDKMRRNLLNA